MAEADETERLTAEEYFSAEDYEWFLGVAAYHHDDPDRLVFADDGECDSGATFSTALFAGQC